MNKEKYKIREKDMEDLLIYLIYYLFSIYLHHSLNLKEGHYSSLIFSLSEFKYKYYLKSYNEECINNRYIYKEVYLLIYIRREENIIKNNINSLKRIYKEYFSNELNPPLLRYNPPNYYKKEERGEKKERGRGIKEEEEINLYKNTLKFLGIEENMMRIIEENEKVEEVVGVVVEVEVEVEVEMEVEVVMMKII